MNQDFQLTEIENMNETHHLQHAVMKQVQAEGVFCDAPLVSAAHIESYFVFKEQNKNRNKTAWKRNDEWNK